MTIKTAKTTINTAFIFSLVLIPCLIIACGTTNQASHQADNEKPTMKPVNERLPACPDKPNCINTEYPDDTTHYLPPLDFPDSKKEQIMPLAKSIILDMGGTVIKESTKEDIKEENKYLAATFTSSLFRFVDDFELRQDNSSHKLHMRSASRTGYSDFGVNKRRIKKFSAQFNSRINNLPARVIEK